MAGGGQPFHSKSMGTTISSTHADSTDTARRYCGLRTDCYVTRSSIPYNNILDLYSQGSLACHSSTTQSGAMEFPGSWNSMLSMERLCGLRRMSFHTLVQVLSKRYMATDHQIYLPLTRTRTFTCSPAKMFSILPIRSEQYISASAEYSRAHSPTSL